MKRRAGPPRKGFALVEMVLVIGALAIIIGLCGVLIHTLLRLELAGRDSLADAATLSRLARQFRADVRAAATADAGGGPSLVLETPGGTSVAYHADGGRLDRVEHDGDTLLRREAFRVERLGPVGFGVEGPRASLRLSRCPDPDRPDRRAVVVEATVAKDRHAAHAPGVQK